MKLELTSNVKDGVFIVSGPHVTFVLQDTGQANVKIGVVLSDGTHINFPDGLGKKTEKSTVLPPGNYDCSIVVAAFSHGAFGDTYDSKVSIEGEEVALAVGVVPEGKKGDDDIQSFTLRVI